MFTYIKHASLIVACVIAYFCLEANDKWYLLPFSFCLAIPVMDMQPSKRWYRLLANIYALIAIIVVVSIMLYSAIPDSITLLLTATYMLAGYHLGRWIIKSVPDEIEDIKSSLISKACLLLACLSLFVFIITRIGTFGVIPIIDFNRYFSTEVAAVRIHNKTLEQHLISMVSYKIIDYDRIDSNSYNVLVHINIPVYVKRKQQEDIDQELNSPFIGLVQANVYATFEFYMIFDKRGMQYTPREPIAISEYISGLSKVYDIDPNKLITYSDYKETSRADKLIKFMVMSKDGAFVVILCMLLVIIFIQKDKCLRKQVALSIMTLAISVHTMQIYGIG